MFTSWRLLMDDVHSMSHDEWINIHIIFWCVPKFHSLQLRDITKPQRKALFRAERIDKRWIFELFFVERQTRSDIHSRLLLQQHIFSARASSWIEYFIRSLSLLLVMECSFTQQDKKMMRLPRSPQSHLRGSWGRGLENMKCDWTPTLNIASVMMMNTHGQILIMRRIFSASHRIRQSCKPSSIDYCATRLPCFREWPPWWSHNFIDLLIKMCYSIQIVISQTSWVVECSWWFCIVHEV